MIVAPKKITLHRAKPKRFYTPEEYFEIDECSEERLEYVDGEIRKMAGSSYDHNDIAGNIYSNLKAQFRGRHCKAHIESIRVRVSEERYRYPDVVAFCGEAQSLDTNPKTLMNPGAIFEVLSPSTKNKDAGEKFEEYAQIPTLTDYVLAAQETMRVRHYRRLNGKDWQVSIYTLPEDVVRLESLDAALTLADIYDEITFPKLPALSRAQAKKQAVRRMR